MQRLIDLSNRYSSLPSVLPSLIGKALEGKEEYLLDYMRTQLFEGKGADGKDLRPLYSEDLKSNGGFFKTAEAAKRYADWKKGLSYPKNVNRNADAPNLYITGRFHKEFDVLIEPDEMIFLGTTAWAERIIDKYNLVNFGLNETYVRKMIDEIVYPLIKPLILDYLNGKITAI